MELFTNYDLKLVLAVIATAISLTNLVYYLWTVFHGKTRPHFYSWLIWGMVTAVAAAVQFLEHAGPGAYLTASVAGACFVRAAVGLFYGEKNITRGDKICLFACMAGIVLWVISEDPLWAVIIVTAVDVGAFYPTARKSWDKPDEENAGSYATFAFTYALGFLAIENYKVETWLYPMSMVLACAGFSVFLVARRYYKQKL